MNLTFVDIQNKVTAVQEAKLLCLSILLSQKQVDIVYFKFSSNLIKY